MQVGFYHNSTSTNKPVSNMKRICTIIAIIICYSVSGQSFDYYGPKPFSDILENSFNKVWTPSPISSITNKKYVVILDATTKSNVIMFNDSDISSVELNPIEEIYGSSSTYGSLLKGIFQVVDINTHLDNDETHDNYAALGEGYRLNPFQHSYYSINAADNSDMNCTDAGSYFISDETNTGYVSIAFNGTASSTTIEAIGQLTYSISTEGLEEVTGWTSKWLAIEAGELVWVSAEGSATAFFLADATDLIALEIEDGSDFNPVNVTYQPNPTASLPETHGIDDSAVLVDIPTQVDDDLTTLLGTSEDATVAASSMLDAIEVNLTDNGASLKYPKEFYLAIRENMLSHKLASTDIYGGKLDYSTVPYVYFTNASDDTGVPHPFMVIGAHAISTRPNLLVDVNRPPGAEQGVGYSETTVTRNGKLGEFLIKIPLKDYGLINELLDNDLTEIGNLVDDFDEKQNTTTDKTVYNYTGLASCGVAVDGVTIYPAYNNNLRFAVEDGEVTHSGIHVGGGLELHYHADGHSFSGNGINLYNLADYEGHDHPPAIGMSYDGNALFGKYEEPYSSMVGYDEALDEYGGHDHGDDFGYHYHAHVQSVQSSPDESGPSSSDPVTFDEHFLLVGAWKGDINDVPGFGEVKMNQFNESDISRYLSGDSDEENGGGSVDEVLGREGSENLFILYPNPNSGSFKVISNEVYKISLIDLNGKIIATEKLNAGGNSFEFNGISAGVFIIKGEGKSGSFERKIVVQ